MIWSLPSMALSACVKVTNINVKSGTDMCIFVAKPGTCCNLNSSEVKCYAAEFKVEFIASTYANRSILGVRVGVGIDCIWGNVDAPRPEPISQPTG